MSQTTNICSTIIFSLKKNVRRTTTLRLCQSNKVIKMYVERETNRKTKVKLKNNCAIFILFFFLRCHVLVSRPQDFVRLHIYVLKHIKRDDNGTITNQSRIYCIFSSFPACFAEKTMRPRQTHNNDQAPSLRCGQKLKRNNIHLYG
jgi:hypothetical protein